MSSGNYRKSRYGELSPKQLNILYRESGLSVAEVDDLSYDQGKAILDKIFMQWNLKKADKLMDGVSEKQRQCLKTFGYSDKMINRYCKSHASKLIKIHLEFEKIAADVKKAEALERDKDPEYPTKHLMTNVPPLGNYDHFEL